MIPPPNSPAPVTTFGNVTSQPKETESNSISFPAIASAAGATSSTTSNALWGATAAAIIGAATAYALDERKKRKEREAQQRAQVQAKVDAFNDVQAAQRQAQWQAQKVQGWLEGQVILNAQIEEARNARMETKMTRFEQAEEASWQLQQKATKEKKQAKDLQAGLAAHYSAMRQGEQEASSKNTPGKAPGHAMIAPPAIDPPPWWKQLIESGKKVVEDAKEWVNTNMVKPAKEAVNKTITTVQNFVTTTVTTVQKTYEAAKEDVKQKWKDGKQWVNTNVVQSAKDAINKTVTIVKNLVTTTATKLKTTFESAKNTVNRVINTIYPEREWQEFTESEKNQLLIELINSGELGRATAEYIVYEEIRLGYLSQPESGAGWTASGNLSFPPNTDLTDVRTIVLTEHEILHINSQGILTRLSVYGELQAWQLEYQAYYELTEKYYGENGTPFTGTDASGKSNESKWKELSQLSLDSREDLERAQVLMKEISPSYRSNALPLEPIHKEILFYLLQGKIKEALDVIPKLLSGR